jgi:deoxyribonuclease-4
VGDDKRLGVCFDTCHAFASGYDLRTEDSVRKTMDEFEQIIGRQNLFLFHLNDSKGALGGSKDRHEHIGKGAIGLKGMKALFALTDFKDVPAILETPIESEGDERRNLKAAKGLL